MRKRKAHTSEALKYRDMSVISEDLHKINNVMISNKVHLIISPQVIHWVSHLLAHLQVKATMIQLYQQPSICILGSLSDDKIIFIINCQSLNFFDLKRKVEDWFQANILNNSLH